MRCPSCLSAGFIEITGRTTCSISFTSRQKQLESYVRTLELQNMTNPLKNMRIRTADADGMIHLRNVTSRLALNASPLGGDFGMVRSQRHKPHQGWDLYAELGSKVYAITPGKVQYTRLHGDYGLQLCLLLKGSEIEAIARRLGANHLYAFYGHLSACLFHQGAEVKEQDTIALSGNSGNAANTPPHLHFEIRREAHLGTGLHGRINPGDVLGYQAYQCTL